MSKELSSTFEEAMQAMIDGKLVSTYIDETLYYVDSITRFYIGLRTSTDPNSSLLKDRVVLRINRNTSAYTQLKMNKWYIHKGE